MRRKRIEVEKILHQTKVWYLNEDGRRMHLLASVSIPEEIEGDDIYAEIFIRLDCNEIKIRG